MTNDTRKSPREFTIQRLTMDGISHEVRVIEYSAYEAAVKRAEHWENIVENELYSKIEALRARIKELEK